MDTQDVTFVEIEARELNFSSVGLRFKNNGNVAFIRAVQLSHNLIVIFASQSDRGVWDLQATWLPDQLIQVEESDEHPSK